MEIPLSQGAYTRRSALPHTLSGNSDGAPLSFDAGKNKQSEVL
jgi:hypothetical protein